MKANLLIETEQFQVFDLGYGATIIDKNAISAHVPPEKENVDLFPNVFFQGDDYSNFLEEINKIEKANLKEDQINYILDQYSEVMSDLLSIKDFEKIGISVKSNKM